MTIKPTVMTWYKHDPHDFLIGVQGMGPDLIGAYIVILDLIYARGGELTRDDHHLAGVLGCSKRLAKSLTDRLIEQGKISEEGSILVNFRAETELKQQRMVSERRSNAQRVRRELEARSNEINDLQDRVVDMKPLREEKRREDIEEKGTNVPKKNEATAPKVDAFRETLAPHMRGDILEDFCKHRKAKKAAFTATAAKAFLKNADACGMSPDRAAVEAIDRNWITVKPEWINRPGGGGSGSARKLNPMEAYEQMRQQEIYGYGSASRTIDHGDVERISADKPRLPDLFADVAKALRGNG